MGADIVLDHRAVDVAAEVLTPLFTHRFPLDRIADAYALFGERRDGVLKIAITP